MKQYINKSAVVAEMERRNNLCEKIVLDLRTQENKDYYQGKSEAYKEMISFLDTLEVKEFQKKKLYVVTRCEEHSDYVEKAFFSEKEAEEYCKQFEGNEDAYGRDFTEIEVDCPLEEKEVDLERDVVDYIEQHKRELSSGYFDIRRIARHFFVLGLNTQKGE